MAKVPGKGHPVIPADEDRLASVLDKSEKAKEFVVEAATDLADVNEALASESIPAAHAVETVKLNKRAEENVGRAATELEVVNAELTEEVAARMELQTELARSKASEKEAWHRSLHDSATGLPNRDLFLERLEHGLVQAKRHRWKLALLCIDLDNFKTANDTYGHHVGDRVLIAVANRLQSTVRAEDTVSRVGGDEFMCVLLDVKSVADAAEIADKITRRIAEPYDFEGISPRIGASVGIAMYPDDGVTSDALLKRADMAMYRAKRNTPMANERAR
jgi:diguanylate cyclase (GGDEF)-like protein